MWNLTKEPKKVRKAIDKVASSMWKLTKEPKKVGYLDEKCSCPNHAHHINNTHKSTKESGLLESLS